MNLFAWLIGLIFPACGFRAADGLPPRHAMDIAHIVRPSSPNSAFAAPAGFIPSPDIVTPPYQVSADRLFALVKDVASGQPRTCQAAVYPAEFQLQYVVRSTVFNFPDLVMVQVLQAGPDRSDLIIYSRSVYGRFDLGVNRKRVDTWLAALRTKLSSSSKR